MTCDSPSAFVVAACCSSCGFRSIICAISSGPITFRGVALLGGFPGFGAPVVVGADAVCCSVGAAESVDDSNKDASGSAVYMLALKKLLLLFMLIALCVTDLVSPLAYQLDRWRTIGSVPRFFCRDLLPAAASGVRVSFRFRAGVLFGCYVRIMPFLRAMPGACDCSYRLVVTALCLAVACCFLLWQDCAVSRTAAYLGLVDCSTLFVFSILYFLYLFSFEPLRDRFVIHMSVLFIYLFFSRVYL